MPMYTGIQYVINKKDMFETQNMLSVIKLA